MRGRLAFTNRTAWVIWSALALVSLILHVVAAANVCCPDEPFGVDGINYESAAIRLLTTHDLLDPLLLSDKAYWPPLWPLTLTVLYTLFGHSLFVARIFEALLVALTSLFAFRLGAELFDRYTGLIAGALVAFSPTFFVYATLHNYEVLIAALLTGALYFLVHSRRVVTRKKEYAFLMLGGVLLGLGVLTKSVLLALIPFVALWEFLQVDQTIRRKISRIVIYAGLSLLTVLPWTFRNYLVYHEFILVNSNGGLAFEIGNNLLASGGNWVPQEWVLPRPGTPMQRALEFIRDHPVRFLNLLPAKFGFFWSQEPIFTHANDFIRIEPLTSFGQKVLQPLNEDLNRASIIWFGIGAGLMLVGSRRSARQGVLVLFVITGLSLQLLFHGEARYRVPLYPLISILHAYAVVAWWRIIQVRARPLTKAIP